jgi:hypothetical protein
VRKEVLPSYHFEAAMIDHKPDDARLLHYHIQSQFGYRLKSSFEKRNNGSIEFMMQKGCMLITGLIPIYLIRLTQCDIETFCPVCGHSDTRPNQSSTYIPIPQGGMKDVKRSVESLFTGCAKEKCRQPGCSGVMQKKWTISPHKRVGRRSNATTEDQQAPQFVCLQKDSHDHQDQINTVKDISPTIDLFGSTFYLCFVVNSDKCHFNSINIISSSNVIFHDGIMGPRRRMAV